MTFKDFIISRLQLFFFLTTLILTAMALLGSIITPDQKLKYYHLFNPMIIAALCVLPTCVTYFKNEPTVKQYIIRGFIELALIEVIVLFFISPPEHLTSNRIWFYVLLAAVVLVIYILAMLMMWLQRSIESNKLTEQLKSLQQTEQSV